MKYLYIVIAVALIAGGYLGVTALMSSDTATQQAQEDEVPEGYHRMPDGTLMRNDMGTEGMGALSDMQAQMAQMDNQQDMAMEVDPNAKVFEVRGTNYAFDVEEIRVKKGETVVINFESADGFHDWALDEFNAQTQKVQPGTKTSVTFVADQTGTFEYYCSVGEHRKHGMVGKLIVEE